MGPSFGTGTDLPAVPNVHVRDMRAMRRTGVARRFGPSVTRFSHFHRFLVRNGYLAVQRVMRALDEVLWDQK